MNNKAIIIGSGINGLTSAYYLLQHGISDIIVIDQGNVPNPISASFGKHRLIHPWSNNGSIRNAERALLALKLWRDLLSEISSDSFVQTGVLALGDHNAGYQTIPDLNVRRMSPAEKAKQLPFFDDGTNRDAYLFSQFGVLFAENILNDLISYLQRNGVRFLASSPVDSVDAQRGHVQLIDGRAVSGERIIIAAGYGTNAIVQSSFEVQKSLLPRFRPMRCYVAYVHHPKMVSEGISHAWASLGVGDMWGMPPLRGIPMKLGCGDFTKPSDPLAADDSYTTAQKIIDKYKQLFPKFDGLEIEGAGMNHWTEISSDSDYIEIDRAVIITSDNGSGFKFAPAVSLQVANLLCGITY